MNGLGRIEILPHQHHGCDCCEQEEFHFVLGSIAYARMIVATHFDHHLKNPCKKTQKNEL